jgi:hypothetical protein
LYLFHLNIMVALNVGDLISAALLPCTMCKHSFKIDLSQVTSDFMPSTWGWVVVRFSSQPLLWEHVVLRIVPSHHRYVVGVVCWRGWLGLKMMQLCRCIMCAYCHVFIVACCDHVGTWCHGPRLATMDVLGVLGNCS